MKKTVFRFILGALLLLMFSFTTSCGFHKEEGPQGGGGYSTPAPADPDLDGDRKGTGKGGRGGGC